MKTLLVCFGLFAALVAGCGGNRKPAQGPAPEYSDESEYANTSPRGSGSPSSSGYYGVSSSGTPEHRPAQPSARP